MLVKDVMSKNLYCCAASDMARTAAKIMKAQGVGALPVVSDSINRRLEGIVTDRDLCCSVVAGAKLPETTRIADVMIRSPITCAAENTLDDCEGLMRKHQVRRLPVTQARQVHSGRGTSRHCVTQPRSEGCEDGREISKPAALRRGVKAAGA